MVMSTLRTTSWVTDRSISSMCRVPFRICRCCGSFRFFGGFCERLAEFSRVILFDKRGMGTSTRVPGATPLDVRMDDVRAVLDDVGSQTAVLVGNSEGGPLSMLAAAAHPDRVSHLILMGAEVRERKDDEWPWGNSTEEEFEEEMATLPDRWGRPSRGFMEMFAPSQDVTPWLADWTARLQANANTPLGAEAFKEWPSASTSEISPGRFECPL